ncbi:LysR family transcriptional regulator [Amycolatopsis dongchuanensis]|uniref:DNA-binding transcriptional regulator, LysR family n=2 Tax=Amycolatopsis TaxID=1813 RepID=A0A1I4BJZ1_9PSEU|nr:DNA-binding transcriptional regulator, LysR family [Amycolatopsis sacchari]
MELQELRIFLVLAEERHFGRTASRLLLSQSRVSQAIRSLERKLDGRLFERTSRSVHLTAFGEVVRDDVGQAYAALVEALQRSKHRASSVVGTVQLGIYNNSLNAGPQMTAVVRAFTAAHPSCAVHFVDVGSVPDPLALLRSGQVDLYTARLPLDQPDLTIGPVLVRQRRVLLVAATDPLAGRESIDYDEIGERPVGTLGPTQPPEFAEAFIPSVTGTGRRVQRTVGNLGTAVEINMQVALGQLVHPTVEGWTEHHYHPDVVAVPIRDLPPSETALCWLTAVNNPRTSAFVEQAVAVLAQSDSHR